MSKVPLWDAPPRRPLPHARVACPDPRIQKVNNMINNEHSTNVAFGVHAFCFDQGNFPISHGNLVIECRRFVLC